MISFQEASNLVRAHIRQYGIKNVRLTEAHGQVLASDVYADRDFPPFDRATKDGIVVRFSALEKGRLDFEIDGVVAAGEPAAMLSDEHLCMEIMTGAVIPYDADTVIMYEDIQIAHGIARLNYLPQKGQNIHRRGSDRRKGELLLREGRRIDTAAIGILAAVGMGEVPVKKLPRVAVISTGDELVEVGVNPQPHQVRRSNAHQLFGALREEGIHPLLLHVADDIDMIRQKLAYALEAMDVLVLSGGVSKGKFDYIPQVLEELGVEQVFHKVLQRPGKPFWFGKHRRSATLVFSFPGNPVSTFCCYYRYFRDWLYTSLGLPIKEFPVFLNETINPSRDLTIMVNVRLSCEDGYLRVSQVPANGSGDLTALAGADGLIYLAPREQPYVKGEVVPFIPTRSLP